MELRDLVHQTGATARQIDHWTSRGYIPVSGPGANPGGGIRRAWTPAEAEFISLMVDLVNVGVQPKEASALVAKLVKKGEVEISPKLRLSMT